MIKLIIFDLDGVLCDCKDLHYDSLNMALNSIDPKYVISYDEHLAKYDGLNTKRKLQLLTQEKGLPETSHETVWKLKQKMTLNIIHGYTDNLRLSEVLRQLKNDGYTLAVASNSIRDTVKFILLFTGLIGYIDFYYSNEDVRHPKPNTEIYLKCMMNAGVSPKETIIVEDSPIGRKAASDSGAHLFPVRDSFDVRYDTLHEFAECLGKSTVPIPWKGNNMKILIPCAGAGSRFEKAGYSFPKPLIPVKNMNDKPMIQVVAENLNIEGEYIFIIRKEHDEKYNFKQLLSVIKPNCKVVIVDSLTEGAACTTLLAKEYIDNGHPLLIANSDQFVEWNSNDFMYSMMNSSIDAGILTFKNSHPKWSYAKVDSTGFVTEVKEKEVISDNATVGVYYWKHGSDYVKYAEQMIAKNIRVNNEFYVCPVFNQAIEDGKRIKIFPIEKMWGIGTPEDLNYFHDKYKV